MLKKVYALGGRISLCFCTVAVAAMAVSAPASLAVPSNFWGVVPQVAPSPEQFQRLKRGGVDSLRIPVSWGAVEPTQGTVDWSTIDVLIKGAASARIDVLPFITGAPTWAVSSVVVDRRNGALAPKTLPVRTGTQRSGWKNFLTQAVLRYGPNGSFWAENPEVPRRPIRVWQIWNEENFKYFVAQPNPGDYGKLIALSHAAIKAVDRGAKIVLGGMFARPKEAQWKRRPPAAYFATDFLEQMYRRRPGIKAKFDGIALHPYTGRYQELTPNIEELRAVMKANHDAGKELWITEIGWSSQPSTPGNSFAKGRGGQAAQLSGAFGLLKSKQREWKIKRVYWFSVDDQAGACNFCDGSGLFSAGFIPKPAWKAFVGFSGGMVR